MTTFSHSVQACVIYRSIAPSLFAQDVFLSSDAMIFYIHTRWNQQSCPSITVLYFPILYLPILPCQSSPSHYRPFPSCHSTPFLSYPVLSYPIHSCPSIPFRYFPILSLPAIKAYLCFFICRRITLKIGSNSMKFEYLIMKDSSSLQAVSSNCLRSLLFLSITSVL